MLGTVINIFRIPDLRNKILFTLALLIIYKVGFHIPVPGFDQKAISEIASSRDTESPLGRAAEYMQMFTGGRLDKSSLFGLGIMPYITSSIILMLLGEILTVLDHRVSPSFQSRLRAMVAVEYKPTMIMTKVSVIIEEALGRDNRNFKKSFKTTATATQKPTNGIYR